MKMRVIGQRKCSKCGSESDLRSTKGSTLGWKNNDSKRIPFRKILCGACESDYEGDGATFTQSNKL